MKDKNKLLNTNSSSQNQNSSKQIPIKQNKTKPITKLSKKQKSTSLQKPKTLDQNEKLKSNKFKIKDVLTVKGSKAQNGPQVTKRLSIMAWNVWNQGQNVPHSNMEHRYNEIVKIITAKNPDIICLQQTEKFRQKHLKQFLQSIKGSYYYSPDPKLVSFNSSIILCKYPSKFYEVKFSKGLKSKPMTLCEFKINCKDGKTRTVVAHSVHLKARSSKQQTQSTRMLQLKLLSKINKCYDISIAAGDYNIDDSHPENKYIKYDFLDLQNHHKNPKQHQNLQQYQHSTESTEFRFQNFSNNFFQMNEESGGSDEYEDEMSQSEYQSQDQFDGYSDSFYDSQDQDEISDSRNYSQNFNSHPDYQDDYSIDNSFSSQDEDSDDSDSDPDNYDSSGSDEYQRRPRRQVKSFRRRIIRKPVWQENNTNRRFERRHPRNRMNQGRPPRNQMQRNRLPPTHQIPDDHPSNTWTYMYYPDKSKYRFDRILMGCRELEKHIFKQKVNVVQFQRVGNYSVGIHSTQKFMAFLFDKIVRSPSDHIGVYAVLFLNF